MENQCWMHVVYPASVSVERCSDGIQKGTYSRIISLNRYISIATLVVSNVGYFHDFSSAVCSRYYIVAPIFKGEVESSEKSIAG